jgi:tRNA-Thr(GGU) m(6)t(6)A37 methyltransferase TsaA
MFGRRWRAANTRLSPDVESMTLRPIGVVRNGRTALGTEGWAELESCIEVLPKQAAGLAGIEGFSHLIVLTWLHRTPPRDRAAVALAHEDESGTQEIGVFALRVPARPNPIGVSVVPLVRREGATLVVRGLDVVDGTPVLDLKPYLPRYDSVPEASLPGWAEPG